jgi:outer membrane protein assembly factor BamB
LSVSANGTQSAILWAVQNSSSQGVLHAYDAGDLTELYNSTQAGTRDQFGPGSKFTPPTVANGKVFVGTQADTSSGGKNYLAIFGPL